MPIRYTPLPTYWVRQDQASGPDANGQPAEHVISDGNSNPCRHCLRDIPKGAGMLVCAARPFPDIQPYAEVGPLFLRADTCAAYSEPAAPPILTSACYLLRGYGADNRIKYGTGQVVPVSEIETYAETVLADPEIAFVHLRSASNNCYQIRLDRA